MHDPRYEPLLGLAYVVDPTPGRHNTANSGFLDLPVLGDVLKAEGLTFPERYEYEKKGVTFAVLNRYLQTVNCAGLCMFSLMMGQPPVREWINAVTGWTLDLDDLLLIGHRIQVLRHAFNLREGIRPEDVSLPDRAKGHPPLGSGPLSDVSLDMETMKRGFFRGMGYDDRGVPSRALLEELELPDLFDDMEEVR